MDFGNKMATLPQILGGVLSFFLALLGVRVTYPVIDSIMGIWDTSIMKVVAILIMWLIYFFVFYVLVWVQFFAPVVDKFGGNE